MKMEKDEVIENLERAIDEFDKMIDLNLESIGKLTQQIEALKAMNTGHLQKMRGLSSKLRELKAK